MKKSFHTVKKAGILTAAAVLGTAALAGCGSKADTTESAAASEEEKILTYTTLGRERQKHRMHSLSSQAETAPD